VACNHTKQLAERLAFVSVALPLAAARGSDAILEEGAL